MTASAPPNLDDPAEFGASRPSRPGVSKWFVVGAVGSVTLLIFLTMSGLLGQPLWRVPYLFVANTPTGGDMGAHVLLPKILFEDLLPSGRLLGWSMDWHAGFPVMYFYFPLPAVATVLLDVVLPYGVAFKLVTVAGLVALPTVSYFFVKFLGFPRFVAAVAGVAGSLFVFMESYSIFGANIKSTLAGEFSFSWSFALSILYVGMTVRNYRNNRMFDPWAGAVLGLTAMAHVITTIVVVVATLPLVLAPVVALFGGWGRFRESVGRSGGVVWSYVIGFGISAFWSVALGVNALSGMSTDMGWIPVEAVAGANDGVGSPIPGEFAPVLVLGVIGIVWTLSRRDDVAIAVWMTVFPLVGYFVIAHFEFTVLYNARLLPYWFFGMYIFAGITVAFAAAAIARRFANVVRLSLVGLSVIVLMLGFAVLSIDDAPDWVKWNYEGYEGKQVWGESEHLMETVDELPDGRIMWEANPDMNKYGTKLALVLFPFWSEGHPSMEGLFFESSLTTPFHFLNVSEVSHQPSLSDKVLTSLNYRGMDFDRGVKHLAVYDVSYYVSYTAEAAAAATEYGLEVVAEPSPWTIFALPDTDRVEVATFEPVVWAGDGEFVDAALEWYDNVDDLDVWLVADGPPDWRRVTTVDERLDTLKPYPQSGTATVTTFEDHTVSFTTESVGVPHLVKVSYFPNWTVAGGDGVYHAAPSLMVVVPNTDTVTLQFSNRWVENVGVIVTIVTLTGLAVYTGVKRRKKPVI